MNNHNQELRFRRSSGSPESVDWESGLHDEHKHDNDHEHEQKRESAPPLNICQKVILKLKNVPCPSRRHIAYNAICGCVVCGSIRARSLYHTNQQSVNQNVSRSQYLSTLGSRKLQGESAKSAHTDRSEFMSEVKTAIRGLVARGYLYFFYDSLSAHNMNTSI